MGTVTLFNTSINALTSELFRLIEKFAWKPRDTKSMGEKKSNRFCLNLCIYGEIILSTFSQKNA